ncbi:hypothetical protein IFM89_010200 [Coptis chinensis]|uniref:Uncharacterized protein n=1 Tax=Coptis chinensis TaxID=261450 RepID=A0A835GX34_9MAGN|nr:hypothetical protein IFM89_010200 [Coptis chinensis]
MSWSDGTFFSQQEITNLRNHLPPQLRACSKIDLLTAFLWRCHTSTLNLNSDDELKSAWHAFAVDTSKKFNPSSPTGFYGNAAILAPIAFATAGELCQKPLGYAVELGKQAKLTVTEELLWYRI